METERQRRANVPGAEVVEIDGLLLAFANVPDPPVKSALVSSEPSDPAAVLVTAEAEFRKRERVFGMDAGAGRHPSVDKAVRSAGFSLLFSWPALAARLDDLPERSLPEGVRVEPVRYAQDASAVARVERSLLDPTELEDSSGIAERFYGPGSYGVEGAQAFVAWEAANLLASRPLTCVRAPSGSWALAWFPAHVVVGSPLHSVTAARGFSADLASGRPPWRVIRKGYLTIGWQAS